jgi:hypothetical protein
VRAEREQGEKKRSEEKNRTAGGVMEICHGHAHSLSPWRSRRTASSFGTMAASSWLVRMGA